MTASEPDPSTATPAQMHVTMMLHRAGEGDQSATEELWSLVYDELRAVAQSFLARERPGHTLQATAVVNEAFLRLVGPAAAHASNRSHFFALAAGVIRHILVDHARARLRMKRGGGQIEVGLERADKEQEVHDWVELTSLDDALTKLAQVSPRAARVVELKYFGGLTGTDIAERLGVSARTVDADWTTARAWLAREMAADPERIRE